MRSELPRLAGSFVAELLPLLTSPPQFDLVC
jgi:hypothetical protein